MLVFNKNIKVISVSGHNVSHLVQISFPHGTTQSKKKLNITEN